MDLPFTAYLRERSKVIDSCYQICHCGDCVGGSGQVHSRKTFYIEYVPSDWSPVSLPCHFDVIMVACRKFQRLFSVECRILCAMWHSSECGSH